MHSYDMISTWLELLDLLGHNKTGREQEDKAYDKNFITAMSCYASETTSEVSEFCLKGLNDCPRVLDVGRRHLDI